jgi:superfamily II DNA or RNA helicase
MTMTPRIALTDRPPPSRRPKKRHEPKLSRQYKPEGMTLEAWQRELRRQFGREQKFKLKNVTAESGPPEFLVTNPASGNTYRVALRGPTPGDNFCSCPDFATNVLGTCKHIEFVLSRLARKPDARAALRAGYQPSYSEVYLQYGAWREVKFRPGTDCPVQLARLASKYFSTDGALMPEAFARFDRFLAGAREIDPDVRCQDEVLSFVAEVRDNEAREKKLQELFPRGVKSAAFKELLRVPLYEYQREGALFAVRAGRCLIGDEMGLGKTVQAIAAAEIFARHLGVERVLIVSPTSLKHQWQREIERFTRRSVKVIGGLRQSREAGFRCDSFFKITNYDTVHADLDLIDACSPDLVILDEAQRIKNWETRTARSVKKIVSPYAIVLTGTPLENRLEELVSIVQFVDRFRLGPTYRLLDEHQVRDDNGRVVGYKNLDRIGKTLEPILIRRKKDMVLDQLPSRTDQYVYVPMTTEQMRHHQENLQIVGEIVQKWQRMRFLREADQRRLMIALQNMRMSCDTTYLLDPETDFGVKADELATLLDELFETPKTKVVVFSQWLGMHEMILRRIQDRAWKPVLFHGGVPGPRRKSLIDRFREDPDCRAFMSTDAGGVGLNLQHASVVVNVDLPWNPAVLEQRIGRVHRLGQQQPVNVVNFVSQGTIEEGMLSVLKFKKSLFAGVLDGGESSVFLGGSKLKRFMETVEKATRGVQSAPLDLVTEQTERQVREAQQQAGEEEEPRPRPTGRPSHGLGVGERPAVAAASAAVQDPMVGLLQTGLMFLQQLASDSRGPVGSGGAAMSSLVTRDESTGQAFLKLPMPNPEVLDDLLRSLTATLEKLRGG